MSSAAVVSSAAARNARQGALIVAIAGSQVADLVDPLTDEAKDLLLDTAERVVAGVDSTAGIGSADCISP
jgi:NAD+--asparagine ADP-ribosyltransferase